MASESPLLEPLTFNESSVKLEETSEAPCMLCDEQFDISQEKDTYLRHLLIQHKFVIGEWKQIGVFKRYVEHWRERFKEGPLTDYCSVIQTNTKDTDCAPSEDYFLLCDILPEDKDLRLQLHMNTLVGVLQQQQKERADTSFSRGCLFCRKHFEENRTLFFNHLATDHGLNVGHPDNLVYTDELLDHLESKLQSLQCLYCEKTFKDRHVLKEHMRKKGHKRLRGRNTTYDKYYIVNYIGLNKPVTQKPPSPSEDAADSDGSQEWADWVEESGGQAVCLFCDETATATDKLLHHLREDHSFDLEAIRNKLHLNFYHQVKLVNYIRRQVHQLRCIHCDAVFADKKALLTHMQDTGHINQLPEQSVWDQPQYFFPTYENDSLLCGLEADLDDSGDTQTDSGISDSNVVIAEDILVSDTILREETVRQDILNSDT